MISLAERLRSRGLTLPKPTPPNGTYEPFTRSGSIIFMAGTTCVRDGELQYSGTLGADLSVEDGQKAAAICAPNLLANLSLACEGEYDRVRALKMNGFVKCLPDFTEQPRVLDGASEIFLLALGDRGRHARAAVGAYALPRGATVEIEAIFEIG